MFAGRLVSVSARWGPHHTVTVRWQMCLHIVFSDMKAAMGVCHGTGENTKKAMWWLRLVYCWASVRSTWHSASFVSARWKTLCERRESHACCYCNRQHTAAGYRKQIYLANARLKLGQRRRRWPNIDPALAEYIAFAGGFHINCYINICYININSSGINTYNTESVSLVSCGIITEDTLS